MMSMISGHALKPCQGDGHTLTAAVPGRNSCVPWERWFNSATVHYSMREHGAFDVDIGQCTLFVSTQHKLLG
jgi:hypothetical protein